jgi:uncharacterized RDD family membrane protein YckC
METPEQIEVDLELPGLGSRFFAQLIDFILKLGVSIFVLVAALIVLDLMGHKFQNWVDDPPYLAIAIIAGLLYIFLLVYDIFFEVRWNGQTPGKWWAGIRVIRDGGAPINFQTSAIRNFLATADSLPVPPLMLLGALLVLLTSRHQRLGDMAAGTIVIRDRRVDLGNEPEDALLKYASEEYTFTNIQLANLTASDRTVLREFLRRCNEMEGRSGASLARKLAKKFVDKTDYPLESKFRSGAEARRFLASLLRDMQEFLKHR